jgi:hypothetical protein
VFVFAAPEENPMIKKIARAAILAVVSVISFTASTSNAAPPSGAVLSGAVVMKGLPSCASIYCR